LIQCIIFKSRKWHTCNYEWYRLYRSYENCRCPGVAILDMQMSKVPIISGYEQEKTIDLSQCCIEYTPPWMGLELTTLVVIGTDCTGNCISNYHTNMTNPSKFLVIVTWGAGVYTEFNCPLAWLSASTSVWFKLQ
jgi:hypothetical protein